MKSNYAQALATARHWLMAPLLGACLANAAWAIDDVPTQDEAGVSDLSSVKRYDGAVLVWRDDVNYDEITFPAGRVSYNNNVLKAAKTVNRSGSRAMLVYVAPVGRSTLEVMRSHQNQLKTDGFKVLFECADNACGEASALTGGNNFNFANMLFKDATFSTSRSEAHVCAGGYQITGFRYSLMDNALTGETLAVMTWRPLVKGYAVPCPDEIEKNTSVMVFHVKK
jgi:OmpA-OmpF porin, OOP family